MVMIVGEGMSSSKNTTSLTIVQWAVIPVLQGNWLLWGGGEYWWGPLKSGWLLCGSCMCRGGTGRVALENKKGARQGDDWEACEGKQVGNGV